ncbi:efflux RND transporter periplasmic adaptor subunit [Ectothiorhodospiraceae bacterium WFHF3C12]|nr:efflux RND transporter periplasmic adaptor subunit [Ectothiorhodospiraceae bacterium WFHF3C12]
MKYRGIVIAVVVVGLAAAGIWYLNRPEPLQLQVAEVERGEVEATVANTRAGTVEAERRAKLAPTTSGSVAILPVRRGDRVEQGQLLLELWNSDLQAELAVARARVEAAEARASQTCVQAQSAEREAARLQRLRDQGSASAEATDRAIAERDAMAAACRASRADADIAERSVETVQAQLERTRLTAPFAGVVAEINGELGEVVTPSPPGIPTPPAVDLIDDSTMYVSAPIDEVDAPAVRVGMPARITLDAFGGRSFPGEVSRIAPYVLDREKQARTVEVEVVFNDQPEDAHLLAGYSADAEIITDVARDVLRVPTEAITEGGEVFVVDGEGILRRKSVTTGIRNWDFTAVTSGLEAGERVVLSPGREGVVDGATVIPVKDAPAP